MAGGRGREGSQTITVGHEGLGANLEPGNPRYDTHKKESLLSELLAEKGRTWHNYNLLKHNVGKTKNLAVNPNYCTSRTTFSRIKIHIQHSGGWETSISSKPVPHEVTSQPHVI